MLKVMYGVVAVLVAACVLLSPAFGEEEGGKKKGAAIESTGTVAVEKDDKGKVTSVKITCDDATYSVILASAKALVKLDGKKVSFTAMEAKAPAPKKGEEADTSAKWIKVSKCAEVKEEAK